MNIRNPRELPVPKPVDNRNLWPVPAFQPQEEQEDPSTAQVEEGQNLPVLVVQQGQEGSDPEAQQATTATVQPPPPPTPPTASASPSPESDPDRPWWRKVIDQVKRDKILLACLVIGLLIIAIFVGIQLGKGGDTTAPVTRTAEALVLPNSFFDDLKQDRYAEIAFGAPSNPYLTFEVICRLDLNEREVSRVRHDFDEVLNRAYAKGDSKGGWYSRYYSVLYEFDATELQRRHPR